MQPQAPTYQRLKCPICEEYAKAAAEGRKAQGEHYRPACQNCGRPIPVYEEGRVRDGFDSFTIHHYHFKGVAGIDSRQVVKAKLCFDCLLADWNVNYPGIEYGKNEQ